MKIPKRNQIFLYKYHHVEYLCYVMETLRHTGKDKTALVKCLAYKSEETRSLSDLDKEWFLDTGKTTGLKVIPETNLPLYIGWGISGRSFEQIFKGQYPSRRKMKNGS